MNLNVFSNLCWLWSKKTLVSSFNKENNFKPYLTKQLLNMFKLWCERGITVYGVYCEIRLPRFLIRCLIFVKQLVLMGVAVILNHLQCSIREFTKPRGQWQRERHKTKGLISRTVAVHVRFECLYILYRPLQNNNLKWPSSMYFGEHETQWLIFGIFYRNWTMWVHI